MATAIRSRQPVRAGFLIAFALLASFGGVLTMPHPVMACSCAMNRTMKENATPDQAIFTGTAGEQQARGVPVQVDRWLWGQGAAPVVWLAASSFGDGAACGITPPSKGSRWLWVAWLPGNNGDFGTGLCSPAGDLDTPEGQAMLADALTVFDAVDPPAPTPAEPNAAPNPAATPDPVATARDRTAVTILAALLVGSLALFGGLVLVARRSAGRADRNRGHDDRV